MFPAFFIIIIVRVIIPLGPVQKETNIPNIHLLSGIELDNLAYQRLPIKIDHYNNANQIIKNTNFMT